MFSTHKNSIDFLFLAWLFHFHQQFYHLVLLFHLMFSCTMAAGHRIGHISARETRLLLWWSVDQYALQRRNRNECSHHIVHISDVSDIVGLWGVLFRARFVEIITMCGVGTASLEMVQGVHVRHCAAFIRCRWPEGKLMQFMARSHDEIHLRARIRSLTIYSCMCLDRYFSVSFDHISLTLVGRTLCRPVLAGE